MKRFIIPALTFIGLVLVASVVWAQGDAGADVIAPTIADPAGTSALAQLTQLLFQILTPIVTIFATWLAHRLVRVFESKTKIDVPDAIEGKIDGWIEEGIHLAAEKSYKKVKDKAEKLKGPEKLEEAADYVYVLVTDRGWDDWTKDKIKAKIEAAIGEHRANGGVPVLDGGKKES